MKIKKVNYECSAVKKEQYPQIELPEIAFAGRSNVGKSSLINSLINRKNLVKTSGKPGKTRTINFFAVNDNFYFVDLPGYGYAAVPGAMKQQWAAFIEEYLIERESLKGVLQLVDIRHKPTELDIQMHNWLKSFNLPTLVVATKADKIAKGKWINYIKIIKNELSLVSEKDLQVFSAETKHGKKEIWNWIEKHLDG